MKKQYSSYHFTLLFALIFTMLGAVCYSPMLHANTKAVAEKMSKDDDSSTKAEQVITIGQHVASTLSFSFESNSDLLASDLNFVHFGLPFEVVHRVLSAIFQNSYLSNIFPFAISAQAP